jgi:hypothetical protein
MKTLIKPLALVAAALAVSPVWAVNKCTGPDGAVVYQEQACGGAAKTELVKLPGRQLADYEIRERDAVDKAKLICSMEDIPYYPAVGWEEVRFLNCSRLALIHKPDAVNLTESAGGTSKQFVFRYDRSYVYTRNGVVTTVQKTR